MPLLVEHSRRSSPTKRMEARGSRPPPLTISSRTRARNVRELRTCRHACCFLTDYAVDGATVARCCQGSIDERTAGGKRRGSRTGRRLEREVVLAG